MATSSLPFSSHFSPNTKPHTKRRTKPPPISISTNPSHLNPLHLKHLLASSNLSCHRFPFLSINGRAEPVELEKLRTALSHSFLIVSVFCRSKFLSGIDQSGVSGFGFEDLFEMAVPVSDSDRQLVGFGRVVSDGELTASIHDVVVTPSLRRLGIGRKIVERITRLFFEACGFGKDSLGSTTMMYTRTAPSYMQDNLMVRPAGRLLLLVPPPLEPNLSKRITADVADLG